MDTMARVREIAQQRDLTLFQLSVISGVSYNTLKSTEDRNGQLSVDTIEKLCDGLHMPMSAFFKNAGRY